MGPKLDATPPVVAGWTLKKLLGQGGFATVWLAERPGESPKALKVLRPEHEGKVSLLEEWDALGAARHPGVVFAHEGTGRHIVMDHVEGPTLTDEMRAQKLWPLSETVDILGHLCDALGAVHAAGYAHHDVNPNNVILGSRPVLIDFGCATRLGRPHPNQNRHPQWLSPEAVRRQPASVLDDLWPIPLFALAMSTPALRAASEVLAALHTVARRHFGARIESNRDRRAEAVAGTRGSVRRSADAGHARIRLWGTHAQNCKRRFPAPGR